MANGYARTPVWETAAAMSLIPKPAGVLAKHNYMNKDVQNYWGTTALLMNYVKGT